jgi:hypothetical protein
MSLGPLFEQPADEAPSNGATQAERIVKLGTGRWTTLGEFRESLARQGVFASEAGISARLRQIRGEGHTVERRIRLGRVFEYLIRPVGAAQQGVA